MPQVGDGHLRVSLAGCPGALEETAPEPVTVWRLDVALVERVNRARLHLWQWMRTVRPDVPDFNPRGCQKGACFSERMYDPSRVKFPLKLEHKIPPSTKTELDIVDVKSSLRSVMWRNVGIERDGLLGWYRVHRVGSIHHVDGPDGYARLS